MADVQAQLLQLFGHAWTAIAVQAEPPIFLNVGQNDHLGSLSLAGPAAAKGVQTAFIDIRHVTHPFGAEVIGVLFDDPEPHCFWPAKNSVGIFRISLLSWGFR